MLEIPNEIQTVLKILDNGMIWVYMTIFFTLMYLLISLLTWNFIKPLKYLGIPTTLVGLLLIIIRLLSSSIISKIDADIELIIGLLPLILKPILINGIIFMIIGILMIVWYSIINNKQHSTIENLENIKTEF